MSGRRNYAYEPDNEGEDTRVQRDDSEHGRRSKWGKRARKVAKLLRNSGGDDTDVTIETPPDGGVSGWIVCIGSAVLTSSNAVVRASLNEATPSINEEFNRNAENYTYCYVGLQLAVREHFEQGAGPGGHPVVECLSLGNPAFYNCMADYKNTGIPRNSSMWQFVATVPHYIAQFCPKLYFMYLPLIGVQIDNTTQDTQIDNTTQPVSARLTVGNMQSPPIPTDVEDIGGVMNFSFVCLSFAAMLIAAILSVFLGYRIVSIVGSILIAAGFIVASFLEEDQKVLAEILVGGVAGIGSSFVRYAAIVAILEYFDELRMRAIVISGLGAVLINFLVIGLTFVDSIDFSWRKTFKFQAIPAGISLLASLVMSPLQRKQGRESRGGSSCSRKCSEEIFSGELFKDVVLYLVILVFFLDQLGRPIFSEGMQPIMTEKGFSQTKVDIQPFIENGGSLLGLLALLVWKTHNLGANLAMMAAVDLLIGLLALHVPEMTSFAWAVVYSAIFGFTEGVFNSVIQDSIPEGFQRNHIKMVAGILGFVAGVGTVVSSFVGDAIDKRADGSWVSYYFAGACLLVCAGFAVLSRIIVVKRREPVYRDDDLELNSNVDNGNQRY